MPVYDSVQDPKNIQGNLNNLSYNDKAKISNMALTDYNKAVQARDDEKAGNHKGVI